MQPGVLVADRFEIEELVGEGGLGRVFRAKDHHTDGYVAIKVVRRPDENKLERFSREASMLAQLRHPGVVGYVAHGDLGPRQMYLAMEWLEGEDLDQRLAREPLVASDAVILATRIAEVLSAVHQKNIVHRDIKPSNLFLCGGACDRVKLLDFGIARLRDEAAPLTATGVNVGTPGYMAPEHVLGRKNLGGAADVFSLGVVLYECVTGTRCYAGGEVQLVLWQDAPRASDTVPDLPPALDALIASMMERMPQDRPTPDEVAEELRLIAAAGGLSSAPQTLALTRSEQNYVSAAIVQSVLTDDGGETAAVGRNKTATTKLSTNAAVGALLAVAGKAGARIGRPGGGALAAFFTGRGAAVDLAERAARCALDFKRLVGDAPVAVSTSSSITTGQLPMREVVEAWSELLAPTVDGVRIDELSAALLANRFEIRGTAPDLYLVGERSGEQSGRKLLGMRTQCVGRKREVGVLMDLFEECDDEQVARAVLVTGPAGIGKSRVRYEFVGRLQHERPDVRIIVGRGDPMSAGSPFAILSAATRGAIGILDGDPREVRLAKLAAAVGDISDREPIIAFMAEFVGAGLPPGTSPMLDEARADPKVFADQLRLAWSDWMARLCAQGTVVLVLEDLHWGDLPTVKLIDAALRSLREHSFMVLALARPGVHDQFPKLWGERELQEIRLGPLRKKAAQQLAKEVLGDSVDDQVLTQIVARADGNPFYLEELIRTVKAGSASDALPGSVLAMAQARLRALPAEARRTLRAASVFGEVFWQGAVRSLLSDQQGDVVDEWLTILESEEMIHRRAASSHADESEFVFRHSLVREAAYSTLTPDDKAAGHRLAAEWLEAAGIHDAAVLAEHFERGGQANRAVDFYLRAAKHAAAGDDADAAIRLATRGLEGGATGDQAIALQLIAADENMWQGTIVAGLAIAEQAASAAEVASELWFTATRPLAIGYYETGDTDKLLVLGKQLAEIVEHTAQTDIGVWCAASVADLLYQVPAHELCDRLVAWIDAFEPVSVRTRIKVLALRAKRAVASGDIAQFLEYEVEASDAAKAAGLIRRTCPRITNVAAGYIELGDYERAEVAGREGVALSERCDAMKWKAWITQNLGVALARLGRFDESLELHDLAIEMADGRNIQDLAGQARAGLALVYSWSGRHDEAVEMARLAVRILDFSKPFQLIARSVLAYVLLERGDATAAVKEAEAVAAELADRDEKLWELDSLFRLTLARALEQTGQSDRAREAIADAHRLLISAADKVSNPDLRTTFLAVPENQQTIALAKQWRASADDAESGL